MHTNQPSWQGSQGSYPQELTPLNNRHIQNYYIPPSPQTLKNPNSLPYSYEQSNDYYQVVRQNDLQAKDLYKISNVFEYQPQSQPQPQPQNNVYKQSMYLMNPEELKNLNFQKNKVVPNVQAEAASPQIVQNDSQIKELQLKINSQTNTIASLTSQLETILNLNELLNKSNDSLQKKIEEIKESAKLLIQENEDFKQQNEYLVDENQKVNNVLTEKMSQDVTRFLDGFEVEELREKVERLESEKAELEILVKGMKDGIL